MPIQDFPRLEAQVVFHQPQGGFLEEGQWIVCKMFFHVLYGTVYHFVVHFLK